jgi:hypothetical protein
VSIKYCEDFRFSNFCDSISKVDCYIGAYSGIEHCLLTQTIGDLFSIVLGQGSDSVALPRLFPFLRGSSFEQLLFSLSWQQKSSLTLLSTANVGRAALATITPVPAAGPILAAAGVAALPSPPKNTQKTLHQEQIAQQNKQKRRAVQGQAVDANPMLSSH